MCTMIAASTAVTGAGKAGDRWFPLTRATVGYDHATHSEEEHALLLDFTNYEVGVDARVALELDLASGRALVAQLQQAIAAAEVGATKNPRKSVDFRGLVSGVSVSD